MTPTPKPQGNTLDERETPIALLLEEAWELGNYNIKDGSLIPLVKQANALVTEARANERQAMLDALPEKMKGCPRHDIPSIFCSSGGCLSAGFFNRAISDMESAIKKLKEKL